MNEHWTCVKEEGINSPQHNSPIYRKGQPRYVSRDPSAIRVGSDVFDYFELLELNIYMRRHIYSKKMGCTRCHRFLLAVIFFATPLDLFSLPTRTASHAIQTFFLRVLALQLAFISSKIFSTVNIWTDMASSLRLHVVDILSLSFVIVWNVSKDEWRQRAVVVESYVGQLGSYGPTGQTFSAQRSTSKPPSRVRSWLDSKYSTVLLPSLVDH